MRDSSDRFSGRALVILDDYIGTGSQFVFQFVARNDADIKIINNYRVVYLASIIANENALLKFALLRKQKFDEVLSMEERQFPNYDWPCEEKELRVALSRVDWNRIQFMFLEQERSLLSPENAAIPSEEKQRIGEFLQKYGGDSTLTTSYLAGHHVFFYGAVNSLPKILFPLFSRLEDCTIYPMEHFVGVSADIVKWNMDDDTGLNSTPFTPAKIGCLEIKNRFVMSAAVDGLINNLDARIERYAKLIEGGVGLIVSGRVLNQDESFEKVVAAVHQRGGKIAMQILSHMGLGFNPSIDSPAASVVPKDSVFFSSFFPYGKHHAASESEIMSFIEDYVRTARIAKEFGVDAIQVHSAHNSALMQFLTPLINQRKDKWGGNIENRTRIHGEIYRAVRAEVGDKMPIFIKLGVEDPFPNGLKFEEGNVAATILADCGYDALEISQGLMGFSDLKAWRGSPLRKGIVNISQEAYFRKWCREIKRSINKPTIMTGGIRSYELAQEILANNEADFIGMCRPFIREPDLVNRWKSGDHKKAACISCNKCCLSAANKLPLACYIKEKWGA